MTRYKTGSYQCTNCYLQFSELVTAEDYNLNITQKCPECGADSGRVVGAPMIMKASYPDGKKRFCKYKEESKQRLAELKEKGKAKP